MYKLKHIPTGLYYQPHKHRGSHLSKRGKIYQTNVHGLSSYFKENREFFTVFCEKDSLVHKKTKDVLNWVDSSDWNQVKAVTKITDWVKEEI